MWLQFIIVFNLCAITNTVLSTSYSLIIFWILLSELTSTDSVNSWITIILLLFRIARARHMSYFYPILKYDPHSTICVSNPSGNCCIKSFICTISSDSQILSSVLLPVISKLYLNVPVNSVGSYDINVIDYLTLVMSTLLISISSM